MSLIFRLAPALVAVGLSFSSPAGHSAADCVPLDFNAVLGELAQLGTVSPDKYTADHYSSNDYIAVEGEQCAADCPANMTAALSSSDMPGPMHLPVVAAPDDVAAWHVEIFERVSQSREDGTLEYYCKL
jgi:hypothetical protein